MREQHTKRYVVPAEILLRVRNELGHDRRDRSLEIQQATFVENHRHRGSRNNFGDRSKIKERFREDSWRIYVVSEPAQALKRDQPALMCDCDRSPRKNVPLNGRTQDIESACESDILMLEGVAQRKALISAVQGGRFLGISS
jgi:hypothetical protein